MFTCGNHLNMFIEIIIRMYVEDETQVSNKLLS